MSWPVHPGDKAVSQGCRWHPRQHRTRPAIMTFTYSILYWTIVDLAIYRETPMLMTWSTPHYTACITTHLRLCQKTTNTPCNIGCIIVNLKPSGPDTGLSTFNVAPWNIQGILTALSIWDLKSDCYLMVQYKQCYDTTMTNKVKYKSDLNHCHDEYVLFTFFIINQYWDEKGSLNYTPWQTGTCSACTLTAAYGAAITMTS